MTRTDALQILSTNLKNPNLIKHSFAAEAAMRGICRYMNPNADAATLDTWGLTGLLHDADYELTGTIPEKHGILITERVNLPQDIAYAIKAHNYQNTKVPPFSQMDWAIATCDQLTGLIVATALIYPSKKLADITTEVVMRKFYDKAFAKGADRQTILLCEEKLNIPLINYVEVVLNSMKPIADSLGL